LTSQELFEANEMVETLMRVLSEKEDLIRHLQRHDQYSSRQQDQDHDDERTSTAAKNDLPLSDRRQYSHPATSAAGLYA
jgi:hypothetical protein